MKGILKYLSTFQSPKYFKLVDIIRLKKSSHQGNKTQQTGRKYL